MKRIMMRSCLWGCVAASMVLASAGGMGSVHLGPPMVCHPVMTPSDVTLAVNEEGEFTNALQKRPYVEAVIVALDGEAEILARMELLRRVARRSHENVKRCDELVSSLAYRALSAQCGEDQARAARTLFDAGYLVGCLDQVGGGSRNLPGASEGIAGYAWLEKASRLATPNAEMEFACVLITIPEMRPSGSAPSDQAYDGHLRRALAGAAEGSVLRRNLEVHVKDFRRSADLLRVSK